MPPEMNRRTEITIEKHRFVSVRRRRGSVSGWCSQCYSATPMVSPGQAAALAGVSVRTVNRWVEAETIHFLESADGQLFVCLNSLREKWYLNNEIL